MKLLAALLFFSTAAQAAVLGYVAVSDGSRIDFHDSVGACVGGAKHAELVEPDGHKTPGCWTFDGEVFRVVVFDARAYLIPQDVVKQPTRS